MKKHFTDETTGISYTLQGDYYLPDLELPTEEKESSIGVWGMRHANYLKQNNKVIYYNLLTSGKLSSYLTDINERAEAMSQQLVKELSEKEDVTEQLKATDTMLWIQKMNNIRNRVNELVSTDIIYNQVGGQVYLIQYTGKTTK